MNMEFKGDRESMPSVDHNNSNIMYDRMSNNMSGIMHNTSGIMPFVEMSEKSACNMSYNQQLADGHSDINVSGIHLA